MATALSAKVMRSASVVVPILLSVKAHRLDVHISKAIFDVRPPAASVEVCSITVLTSDSFIVCHIQRASHRHGIVGQGDEVCVGRCTDLGICETH